MAALALLAAAETLGISPRALRRMIDNDAPVARAGGRGRGNSTLVDPDAIRAWIDAQVRAPADDAHLRAFVGRLPEIVAEGLWRVFMDTAGPHKLAVAQAFVSGWYQICTAALDEAGAPELCATPDKICRLGAILA